MIHPEKKTVEALTVDEQVLLYRLAEVFIQSRLAKMARERARRNHDDPAGPSEATGGDRGQREKTD